MFGFWILLFFLCCGNSCNSCNCNECHRQEDDCRPPFPPPPPPQPRNDCGCDNDFVQPRNFNAFPGQGTCGCEEKPV